MLVTRVEEILGDEGIRCRVDEVRPTQVRSSIECGKVDMIITSSPIPDVNKLTVPVIKGHSLLSGFGEEETIEEIRKVAHKIIDDYEAAQKG
jgi:galactitol-specific phosphotransferase system IIB component